jgi:hypothetical protein
MNRAGLKIEFTQRAGLNIWLLALLAAALAIASKL